MNDVNVANQDKLDEMYVRVMSMVKLLKGGVILLPEFLDAMAVEQEDIRIMTLTNLIDPATGLKF